MNDKHFIKWWQHILLIFLPTYVAVDDGYALHYKNWRGVTYVVKEETLPSRNHVSNKENS